MKTLLAWIGTAIIITLAIVFVNGNWHPFTWSYDSRLGATIAVLLVSTIVAIFVKLEFDD